MDLSGEIAVAEDLFREKLEACFKGIFSGTTIDSHGLDHHRRVWTYAKDLLTYPEISRSISEPSIVLKLLIGAYLHDSGMATDRGPDHGIHSKIFCEKFLLENELSPADFADILYSVENHDKKEYISPEKRTMLFDILSVADDLDALGFIGIYRYLEIYLLRGISLGEIGPLIINNVSGRFMNLEKTFSFVPSLAPGFRQRLEVITDFFEKYSIQVRVYRFGSGNPSGYCGVAEIIDSMIKNKLTLEDVIDMSVESADRVISWYFGELRRELS